MVQDLRDRAGRQRLADEERRYRDSQLRINKAIALSFGLSIAVLFGLVSGFLISMPTGGVLAASLLIWLDRRSTRRRFPYLDDSGDLASDRRGQGQVEAASSTAR
jgi:hypothetical protein